MRRSKTAVAVGVALALVATLVPVASADSGSGEAVAFIQHRNTAPGEATRLGSFYCGPDTDLLRWTEEFSNGDRDVFLIDETVTDPFASWVVGIFAPLGIVLASDAPPGPLTLIIECIDTSSDPDTIVGVLTIDLVVIAPFDDVPVGAFYTDAVTWARLTDVTTGTSPTTFSPDDGVTRWQMALFLLRLHDWFFEDAESGIDSFVDTGHLRDEFREAIGWLADTRITTGVGDNRFDPDGTVTRWQMALFLSRLADFVGIDIRSGIDSFVDTGHLRDEFREAIGWLAGAGITTGVGGNRFDPDGIVTRAQMVTFLHRLFDFISGGIPPFAPSPDHIACPVAGHAVLRADLALTLWRLAGEPVVASPGSASYADIPAGSVYDEAVGYVLASSIMTGTSPTGFSPLDPLTRAQYMALFWRFAGLPAGHPPHPYVDVLADWQQAPVDWAAAVGTPGITATTFFPDDRINHRSAADFVDEFLGSPDPPGFDYYDCTLFGT